MEPKVKILDPDSKTSPILVEVEASDAERIIELLSSIDYQPGWKKTSDTVTIATYLHFWKKLEECDFI